jgi:hypothetical protein
MPNSPAGKLPQALTGTLAVVGVVASSFFTYLSSRAEADAAKLQTAASYVAMEKSIGELQEAVYEAALENAKLEGRLDAIEAANNARFAPEVAAAAVPAPVPAPVGHIDRPPRKLARPPSLNQAVMDYQEKL